MLLLRYMQELDYGEIAVALAISEGTVKSRISRAKARLRNCPAAGTFPPTPPSNRQKRRDRNHPHV